MPRLKKEKPPKKDPLLQYDDKPRKLSFERFIRLIQEKHNIALSEHKDLLFLGLEKKKEVEGDFFCPCLPGKERLCISDECLQEIHKNGICYAGLFIPKLITGMECEIE